MKKGLFLVFALVCAASFAFAQSNTSAVSQTGDDNEAIVNQQGNSHSSTISQTTWGTGQYAEVTQNSGNGNSSDILQDQRGAAAYVLQQGNENTSGIKQSGPNQADINQQGDHNTLGSYSDYTGRAFQKNGTSFDDDKNELDLDQYGDWNMAGVWQEHHADATIEQDGNGNEAKVYQSGTSAGGLNEVTIYQVGDQNMTDAMQDGEANFFTHEVYGYDNAVNAMQDGFDNTAIIDQYTWKDVDNYSNEVDLYQHNNSSGLGNRAYLKLKGDNNSFNISQSGSWNQVVGTKGMFPDVTSKTIGSRPDAYFKHEGDGSMVSITQDGNQNLFSGEVYNGNGNLDITQQGNVNRIFTEIGDASNVLVGNGVDIDQIGNNNRVDVQQGSNYNSASTSQTGNGNTSTIMQN